MNSGEAPADALTGLTEEQVAERIADGRVNEIGRAHV